MSSIIFKISSCSRNSSSHSFHMLGLNRRVRGFIVVVLTVVLTVVVVVILVVVLAVFVGLLVGHGLLVGVLLVVLDVVLLILLVVLRVVVVVVLLVVLLVLLVVEIELLLSGLQDVVEGPGDVDDVGGEAGRDLGRDLFLLLGSSASSSSSWLFQGPTGAAVTLSLTVSQGPKGPMKGKDRGTVEVPRLGAEIFSV